MSVEVVVAAARACFAAGGISGARMDDIARHAGVSRAHLYAFVSGRPELIKLAAMARLGELGQLLSDRMRESELDLEDSIVEQVLATARAGREDPEFVALAEAIPRFELNEILTSADSPVHEINSRIFGPVLGRAMTEGRLRTDVPIDAIVEWLQRILASEAGRAHVDDEALRVTVRRFVLPAILT